MIDLDQLTLTYNLIVLQEMVLERKMMPLSTLELHDSGRVAVISMNRVKGHNALSMELCDSIYADLSEAASSGARAVLLRSSAEHFCVGADLHERRSLGQKGLLNARSHSEQLTQQLIHSPIPTIAVIHGYALGGGLELALACDYIIAESTAKLGLPEAGIGIIPGGGGTQLLNRRVSWGTANRMLFTGDPVDAHEAERLGLVDECREEGTGLACGFELAAKITRKNPQSIRLIKEAVLRGAGTPMTIALRHESHAWRVAALSEDYQQGLASYAGKVPPPWA